MSRELTPPTPKVHRLNIVAGVAKGGTGGTDTGSAATSLGALSAASLGAAGGALKLKADQTVDLSKLPASFPQGATIDGPSDFYVSASHTLTISNYDKASEANYTTSVTGGTVSRVGAVITFVAPATPGVVQLNVAGRVVNIQVLPTGVIKPTVTTPVNNAINQTVSVAVASSAFQLSSGTGTHQFSDWELSTTSDFSNVIQSSFNDTVNKTSWSLNNLSPATNYYLRVRYKDTTLGYSDWSVTSKFSTKNSFIPSSEEAILIADDKLANARFGRSVSLSSDGSRLTVGAYLFQGTLAGQGKVYVFTRTGSTWAQEAAFVASDPFASANFGQSVSISGDGARIAVGAWGFGGTYSSQGKAYVFSRTGTTWTQEAAITPSDAAANSSFGFVVNISLDSTRMIIGAKDATYTLTNQGKAYIYSRSGATWTQEAIIVAGDPVASSSFGYGVSINSDGTRVAIGAPLFNGNLSAQGKFYIFVRSGTTWTQEAAFIASDPVASSMYGAVLCLNSDATRLVVTAYQFTGTQTNQGKAYVFLRSGTTWVQEAEILCSDIAVAAFFGGGVSMNGAGSMIAIGASGVKVGTKTNQGMNYVFTRNGVTWSQQTSYTSSNGAANDGFARNVSIASDGSRIAAGSASAAPGGTANAGSAYIYA